MKHPWRQGNRVELLENGEAFFPRVFDAIANAKSEVVLETFILFADKVGNALHAAVLSAARRGVSVDILVDGYGSPDLSDEFVGELTAAGVRFHVFDPRPRWLGVRTNVFRRMHRKIVVIDAEVAFVGGINYSADHLADFGPEAKQDYAVEVHGPIVEDIHEFALKAIAPLVPLTQRRPWRRWKEASTRKAASAQRAGAMAEAGPAEMLFVTRDNDAHQSDIERQYRVAIRAARHELMIANAYFFPGYRLLRDLRNAARRGVRVRLVLQGEPDMPIVKLAAGMLYGYLVQSGVLIYEYCERPLHGKVALADDVWSTVGSSNLDPLSLSLNLEANVFIRDRAFNQHLRERLEHLIDNHCKQIGTDAAVPPKTPWRLALGFVVFHFLRRFPSWSGWLPAHVPKLATLSPHAQRAQHESGNA